LPKSIVKHLTKLRISAHTLLIEKGRYHRPKISRNLRLCSSCNKIEDEEHFMLYCNRYYSLHKSLFSNLNINSDYCNTNHVHVDRTLSTLRRLLNPILIYKKLKLFVILFSQLLLFIVVNSVHLCLYFTL
jgi:hypothetical protein